MTHDSQTEHLKHRPSIPLLLWCAFLLWIGCYLGFSVIEIVGISSLAVCLVGGCIVVSLTFYLVRQHPVCSAACIVGIFFLLGMLICVSQCIALDQQRSTREAISTEHVRIKIEQDPSISSYGISAIARIYPDDTSTSFLVRLYAEDKGIRYGSEGYATLSVRIPDDESREYYNRNGLVGYATLDSFALLEASHVGLITKLRDAFVQRVQTFNQGASDEAACGLMAALAVGDRTDLFEMSFYQEVKVLGLAHLVAVSGSHLVIIMGFLGLITHGLRLPKSWRIGIQLVVLVLYLIMVGFPISCIRAAAMSAVSMTSFSLGRRSHALSSLAVIIIVLITIMPSSASSLSFTLSVLSTAGIILFMPLFMGWVDPAHQFIKRFFLEPCAMTTAALVTTFPISVSSFSQFSFISPISNTLVAPLVTLVCCSSIVGFVAGPIPVISDIALWIAYMGSVWFVELSHLLVGVPFAAIALYAPLEILFLIMAMILIALWMMWPQRLTGMVVVGLCALLCVPVVFNVVAQNKTELVMLDVGQGDAFLLRSQGRVMLVDTGNNTQKLLAALSRQQVYHLDGIIISHADDDHCGSLEGLKGIVSCDQVFVSDVVQDIDNNKVHDLLEDAAYLSSESGIKYLAKGDEVSFGWITLRVVSPETAQDDGGNQDSLCFVLSVDFDNNNTVEWSALFCGDAETQVTESLARKRELEEIDILKVSHHGAKAGFSEELAQGLNPSVALISVGSDNTYGHPHQDTLDTLEEIDAQVFRSDINGDVICSFSPRSISVSTLK